VRLAPRPSITLRSPDRFGAWLCGITLNVARRWLRQLRPEVTGLSAGLLPPGRDPAAELGISVGAVKARLHQARAAPAPKLTPLREVQKEDTVTEGTVTRATGRPRWNGPRSASRRSGARRKKTRTPASTSRSFTWTIFAQSCPISGELGLPSLVSQG
jgi:hypothetical protein